MDMMWYRRRGLMVTPHIESVTGAIASFNSDYNKIPIKSLICDIEPIQKGSGDPSPENVRPISGRTGLSVTMTGVNVWDEETKEGYYSALNGTFISSAGQLCSKNQICVKPSTKYWYYKNIFLGDVLYYGIDGSYLGSKININTDREFVTPANCYFIQFNIGNNYGSTYNHDISINYPSTDHNYHDYQGETYGISFPSEVGIVYGGSLDVVRGKLIVDRAIIASYNGESLPSTWISDRDVYAAGATPTTGAQVVYKLAEPIEYQLTPQEVKTILGVNNIWCDSGKVSVNYWKWGK